MTDHAEATAEMLEKIAKLIRNGDSPEDWGWWIEKLGRVMQRRT